VPSGPITLGKILGECRPRHTSAGVLSSSQEGGYVARDELTQLLERAPLDPAFVHDLTGVTGATVEDL